MSAVVLGYLITGSDEDSCQGVLRCTPCGSSLRSSNTGNPKKKISILGALPSPLQGVLRLVILC